MMQGKMPRMGGEHGMPTRRGYSAPVGPRGYTAHAGKGRSVQSKATTRMESRGGHLRGCSGRK